MKMAHFHFRGKMDGANGWFKIHNFSDPQSTPSTKNPDSFGINKCTNPESLKWDREPVNTPMRIPIFISEER